MAMNTEYLSMDTSTQSNINTPYTNVGVTSFSNTSSAGTMWVNDFVVRGSYTTTGAVVFGSTMSVTGASSLGVMSAAGAATFSSTVSIAGATTHTSTASFRGAADFNSGRTQAGLLSYLTTASATSAILPDGAFGIYFHSGNSCRLCFRSGATTYTVIATTGAVL